MEVSLPNHFFFRFVGSLGFHGDAFGMDCSSVSAICSKDSCFATFAGFHGKKRHMNFKDCGPMVVGSYMANLRVEYNIIMCFVSKTLKHVICAYSIKGFSSYFTVNIPLQLCI